MSRFAYLGPSGTFTEQALLTVAGPDDELVAYSGVPQAFDALRGGEVDGAFVPFENSVEGSVPATLDELASGEPLRIVREVYLPVRFGLMARPGTTMESIAAVGTHPHAAAQCRRWIAGTLPRATIITAASTADAAEGVSTGIAPYDAAIGAPVAAERYGLVLLADGIGDNADAVTRFVLIARPGQPPAPSGADKTSLVAVIRDDHAGALLELLTEFSLRSVNMTRIESRPTGAQMGRYSFSIDCEGHVADARVVDLLQALHRRCAEVRFLGSYPRADAQSAAVALGNRDEDYAEASDWARSLGLTSN